MGLSLENDSLEAAVERAVSLLPRPSGKCLSCRAFSACGGGYLPHRWDGVSFDNPSAYCGTLLALYDHVVDVMRQSIAEAGAKKEQNAVHSLTNQERVSVTEGAVSTFTRMSIR